MSPDPAEAPTLSGVSDAESPIPWLGTLLPGIALCGLIAAAALLLRRMSGVAALSPMIVSIGLGALVHNWVGIPAVAKPGVLWSRTERPLINAPAPSSSPSAREISHTSSACNIRRDF